MRKPEYIVVHHVGGWVRRALDLVREAFTDIPYDYIVHVNGRIEPGRSLAKRGAHCIATIPKWKSVDFNARSIGVALNGNFQKSNVPEAQFNAASELVSRLARRYSIPTTHILMHRQVTATACPGKRFADRWQSFVDALCLESREGG